MRRIMSSGGLILLLVLAALPSFVGRGAIQAQPGPQPPQEPEASDLTMPGESAIKRLPIDGSNVFIYPTKGKTVFCVSPIFNLVQVAGKDPIRVYGNRIQVDFAVTTPKLYDQVAEHMTTWVGALGQGATSYYTGPNPVSADMILPLPLRSLRFALSDAGDRSDVEPYDAVKPGESWAPNPAITVTFKCRSEVAALKIADDIRQKAVQFHITYSFVGVKPSIQTIVLKAKDVAASDWSNAVGPRDIYADNQYVSRDQVARAVETALRRKTVDVTTDAAIQVDPADIRAASTAFLAEATDYFSRPVDADALKGLGAIYIDDKSLQADEVVKEASEYSTVMDRELRVRPETSCSCSCPPEADDRIGQMDEG